jgi:hypothetical protein
MVDIQQDDDVTSQQKCDMEQNHSVVAAAGSSNSEENKDPYTCKEHYDVALDPESEGILSGRRSPYHCGMDVSSSPDNTKKDIRDSDICRVFMDKHSMDDEGADKRNRRKETEGERARDKSDNRDVSGRVRSEDKVTDSRKKEEKDRDKRLEGSLSEREKSDAKRGDSASSMEDEKQDSEQIKGYKNYDESNTEPQDRSSISDMHHPSDFKAEREDGGDSCLDKGKSVRSELGWMDSGDHPVPLPNCTADTPRESRVVRYRSRSRSLSPDFRGWEDVPARRVREDERGRSRLDEQRNSSRERFMGHPRLNVETSDSAEDDRIRESSTDRDGRIRNSSRDHERIKESCRDRMGGSGRDRLRESSRDRDRMRENSRDQDRIRDSIRDHDRLRESSRDQEKMRLSSRDRVRLHDSSRDRDRSRDNSRDLERVRDGSRNMDRIRSSSRDQDRMRDSSREYERIRERQADRERRDERCIRDRWSEDMDRGRDREHNRKGDRHWEKERRERKKGDRNREHDRDRGHWAERRSCSPLMEDRKEHENSGSGYYIPDIPLPVTSGSESWGSGTGIGSGEADMELSCSPASSPLVGFKRSLADSTISDSELVAAAGKQEENRTSSPFQQCGAHYNTDCYPPTQEERIASPAVSPTFSPKRIPLDDRIELELGVKKSTLPLPTVSQQIPVYHHQSYPASYAGYQGGNYYPVPPPQPHYEGNLVPVSGSEKLAPGHPHYMQLCEEFSGPSHHEALHHHHPHPHKQFVGRPHEEIYRVPAPKRRPPLLPTPSNIAPDMSHWDSPEAFIGAQEVHKMVVTPEQGLPLMMGSETFMSSQQMGCNSHVVQVGNVLQVVPTDLPPGNVLGAVPPPPPPPLPPPPSTQQQRHQLPPQGPDFGSLATSRAQGSASGTTRSV